MKALVLNYPRLESLPIIYMCNLWTGCLVWFESEMLWAIVPRVWHYFEGWGAFRRWGLTGLWRSHHPLVLACNLLPDLPEKPLFHASASVNFPLPSQLWWTEMSLKPWDRTNPFSSKPFLPRILSQQQEKQCTHSELSVSICKWVI